MILISLLMVLITVLYLHHKWNFGYWRRRKVPGPAPWPLVGNMLDVFLLRKNFLQLLRELYAKYPNEPYIGFYRFNTPCLLVRDVSLGRKILVQDFNSFMNTDLHANEVEVLIHRNIFMLKNEEWKRIRDKVAPLLSSAKIKRVFPLMSKICDNLIAFINKENSLRINSNSDGLETKEMSNKFTVDSVASCAFGLEAKCLTESNSTFREMGRRIFDPSALRGLSIAFTSLFPFTHRLITLHVIPPLVSEWLFKVVSDTVQYRRDNNIRREDFLQYLMQLHDQNEDFTMLDVTAQCTSFLMDGFETSGSVLTFSLYELARNPDIQERLLEESNQVLTRHDGRMCYDALIEMNYADAIVHETLRKWPVVGGFTRECTKTYELATPPEYGPGNINNKGPLILQPGDSVIVAIGGFHTDPKYFPSPDVFDPSRFLDGSHNKDAFYPWGAGPRLCIGQRFALLQAKCGLVTIVRNFKLSVSKKMPADPGLEPRNFVPRLKGGTFLIYTPRNQQIKSETK